MCQFNVPWEAAPGQRRPNAPRGVCGNPLSLRYRGQKRWQISGMPESAIKKEVEKSSDWRIGYKWFAISGNRILMLSLAQDSIGFTDRGSRH